MNRVSHSWLATVPGLWNVEHSERIAPIEVLKQRTDILTRIATVLLLFANGQPAGAWQSPLPRAPQGFRVELVDEAPSLLWPSAVHCLSDGSLLVAENPMDMPGPANQPIDRILLYRWKEDGSFERTIFAHELFAVLGMQEVDGSVYVVNMPHITVLRDVDGDGVADLRSTVVSDLGPDAPGWPGGYNEHAVSGIQLGMDGWLYVSVGDKGIPRATGADGLEVSLRGGGILRMRPDGSRLEVVSSGTRSHLDVALDDRDELFTFDADDGEGWFTRLTHQIPGGEYGYPWDYRLNPERALPPMAEYGPGEPAGGMVYRGDAWPTPYPGSLFFCEWAEGTVRRFELARDGASHRVTLAEDFLVGGPLDTFRPTDVCESPDGRFLYVSDWGYDGRQSTERTGRLFRVRRSDDRAAPGGISPSLFEGDQSPGADGPLLAERNYHARRLAQRRLARLDDSPESEGRGLARALELLRRDQPIIVRRHALWALEEMAFRQAETREFVAQAIENQLRDGSAEVRGEAARALGSRQIGSADALIPLLRDPDPVVRRNAGLALGRLGDPVAIEALVAALDAEEEDLVLRGALRGALRALSATGEVLARLPGRDERARLDWKLVLRARYELPLVRRLAQLADEELTTDVDTRTLAVELLSEVHRGPEPWDGSWWRDRPTLDGYPPKSRDWAGTAIVLRAMRDALEDSDPRVQRAALFGIANMPDPESLPWVRATWFRARENATQLAVLDVLEALRDSGSAPLLADVLADRDAAEELQLRAIEVAAEISSEEMVRVLSSALGDPSRSESQIVACLAAIGSFGDPDSGELVQSLLSDPRPAVRASAARALGAVRGESATDLLVVLVEEDISPVVRGSAARALGEIGARAAVPVLMKRLDDEEALEDIILALCDLPDPLAVRAYLLGLESRSRSLRERSADALREVRIDVRNELEAMKLGGRLGAKVLPQVQRIYSEPRPVSYWRILGPIPLSESPLVSDGPLDVEAGLASLGTALQAIDHESLDPEGAVDLRGLFGDQARGVAYVATNYDSPIDRRAHLSIEGDATITIWVDEREVAHHRRPSAGVPMRTEVSVRLHAGENRIVARVAHEGDAWNFRIAIGDAGTGPLFDAGIVQRFDARAYRELALEGGGNSLRGQRVFEDVERAACIKCHSTDGSASSSGPDLYDIGERYRRADLITSVLDPSQRVATGYRASWFEFKDSSVVFGQIQREEDDIVWIIDPKGNARQIDLGEVVDRGNSPISLMPEGIPDLMTARDFADLIAYLETLRGDDALPPSSGENGGSR